MKSISLSLKSALPMLNNLLHELKDLDPREQDYVLNESIKDLYLNDFFVFAKELVGYRDITWSTHGDMVKALEDDSTRKLIVVPRDTFKSSLGDVAYALWRVVKNPNIRILIDSELVTNSETYLREIKGHMKSQKFIDIFGEFEHPDRIWGSNAITIAQRTRNLKEPTITCGGIGTTKVGQHYDLIIGDDYNSQNNSDTPEKANKVVRHVKYNMSILDSKAGEYVFIATRYSEVDIPGWILRDILNMPFLAEGEFKSIELNGLAGGDKARITV